MSEVDILVRPFYMLLLHGNFVGESVSTRSKLFLDLHRTSPSATDKALVQLIDSGGWRERLCAAWFIGLTNRTNFEPRIAELLLKSENCYAGQGYCFALARFGSENSSHALQDYLKKYLPVKDREYDQEWALGALHFISHEAASGVPRDLENWNPLEPERGITDFAEIMTCIRAW